MLCFPGELEKCPNLKINSSRDYHQLLTWDPPSTLNITAVEPDISSYIVCSNISNECTTINVTEAGDDSSDLRQYKFPNLRVYINFTVTAVNIVGNGESTSVVTTPCKYENGTFSNQSPQAAVSFDTESRPSLSVKVMVSNLVTTTPLLLLSSFYITLTSCYMMSWRTISY